MEAHWIETNTKADLYILVGDIGGTHTSLGLAGKTGRSYRLIAKFLFKTGELGSFLDALRPTQEEIVRKIGRDQIGLCCISVAGPVRDNRCTMTNVPWEIIGAEIEAFIGARTIIINDFTAISYALPLLNTTDSSCITPIPRPDAVQPGPTGFVRAVIGAGTGLGVGLLVEDHGRYIACPSEGGHTDWMGYEPEHHELYEYIFQTEKIRPEAEHLISGPGIARIFRYLSQQAQEKGQPVPSDLQGASNKDLPALISARREQDPICRETIDYFVRFYARFATNISLTFLPTGGLFLAGGIVGKNEAAFLKNYNFSRTFLNHPRPSLRKLLESIPLYMIKDYSISLLGAANAAYSLL